VKQLEPVKETIDLKYFTRFDDTTAMQIKINRRGLFLLGEAKDLCGCYSFYLNAVGTILVMKRDDKSGLSIQDGGKGSKFFICKRLIQKMESANVTLPQTVELAINEDLNAYVAYLDKAKSTKGKKPNEE
jgi:hypothetical protein